MFVGSWRKRFIVTALVTGALVMAFAALGPKLFTPTVTLSQSEPVQPAHTPPADEPTYSNGKRRFLPLPGHVFKVNNHIAWTIEPPNSKQLKNKPWVFFVPTLAISHPGEFHRTMFRKFLDAGVSVAGIDIGESFGNPRGRSAFTEFYKDLVTTKGFSGRPCMLAQSRGGLQVYNWAVEHPDSIGCIAGIYPVCNLSEYPSYKVSSAAYGLGPKRFIKALPENNPIDRIGLLAPFHVPILHMHGDKDTMVPLEKHSALLAERYRQAGGDMKVIVVPGMAHGPWPQDLYNNQELIDFLIAHARGKADGLPKR